VSDLEKIDPQLKRQYVEAYGEYYPGEYRIGDTVAVPGTSGEIIWSYRPGENGPLTYVVDDQSGFPIEVLAADVYGPVEPWK
jgi:hypothetical protein